MQHKPWVQIPILPTSLKYMILKVSSLKLTIADMAEPGVAAK